MLRESTTLVLDRNARWHGDFASEPAETAWASEAIFFVRLLAAAAAPAPVAAITARVQISPDGIRWCDEGTTLTLPTERDAVAWCRVRHFGGWLRLAGTLPPGDERPVMAYLVLKA